MDWFHTCPLGDGLTLVSEPGHVACYLIEGDERALLIDAGLGVAALRPVVQRLTTRPVTLLLSHAHFDHIGGVAEFDDVHAHAASVDVLGSPVRRDWLETYDAAAHTYEAAVDDGNPRPWPPRGFALERWFTAPAPVPTAFVADGDEVDLGGRVLRVVHTPGHAPDHICLVDERRGILFAQDQAYLGSHLLGIDRADPHTWVASAHRLATELAPAVATVHVAHGERLALPPSHLLDLARAGEALLAGETRLEPGVGLFGEEVLIARHDGFELLLASSFTPATVAP